MTWPRVLAGALFAAIVMAGCGDSDRERRQEVLTTGLLAECDEGAVIAAHLEEQVARLERRQPDVTVPAACR